MARRPRRFDDGGDVREAAAAEAGKRLTPHLKEDAVKSFRADLDRIKRGPDASGDTGRAAKARMAGRAWLGGAAYTAGEELGKGIERVAPGTGKAIVDNTVGPVIDRIYGKPSTRLTPEAQRRVDAGELEEKPEKASSPAKSRRTRSEDSDAIYKKGGKVKKYAAGGSVTASRRADGIAQRGKTRGKVC